MVRVNHVVQPGYFCAVDQGKVQCGPLGLFYVALPRVVVVDRVDAEANNLDVALVPFGLESGYLAEFRGADRCEVFGV